MPSSSRAFTLVEVVVAAAIVGTLAAITYPLFAKAKDKASETSCVSNFRQIHLALSQYRTAHDGTDAPAPSDQMGFPEFFSDTLVSRDDPRSGRLDILACRGRPWDGDGVAGYGQIWAPPRYSTLYKELDEADWIRHVTAMGSSSIVFADTSHQIETPAGGLSIHRVLGLRIDGSVKWRLRRGFSFHRTWWEDEMP